MRRAQPGEKLTTLDGTVRELDPDDLVVTDDTGPIALAGVMGGASTEIDAGTTDIVLEAAHWEPTSIARAVRRHKLPSEAAKRFERGVDPEIAAVALQRCVDLLVQHGGAVAAPGFTVVGPGPAPVEIRLRSSVPVRSPDFRSTRQPSGGDSSRWAAPSRSRRTHGHPAELAARSDRSGRPRRGSRAPGGLRPHPVGAAYPAARPRPVRRPTTTADLGASARRRRLYRSAELPVRLSGTARPVRPGRRRPAPARDGRRQPAV